MFGLCRRELVTIAVSISLLVPMLASGIQAVPGAQTNQQYQAAAQQAIKNPFRVDVHPAQQGVKQGSPAVVKIQLHNANNEPVNALETMTFIVTAKSPASKEQVQKVEIASGKNSGEVTLQADEAGLWKLEVRESKDHLVGGSNYLMVSPAQKDRQKPARRREARPIRPATSAFMFAPRLVLASYSPQEPPSGGPPPALSSKPTISLAVSGDADNKVLADGISAAEVHLFLYPPQSSDVHVMLNVSQGKVSPQMVTIKARELEGGAEWTSNTTAEKAKVSISQVTPKIANQVMPHSTIDFVDPIVAIAFFNPPSGLNIVERGTVAVQFVDRNGFPVPAHAPISYSFNANSARLRLTPVSDQTKPDAADFRTSIIPSGLGAVIIEAAVPHLRPIRQTIQITGFLLLILCAFGGILGGLVNHLDRKQKGLAASLVTGMVVALPITWLYVWVGLPHLDTAILHNQLSALMLAIVAGMSGAGGLKKAAQKFGFDLFESAEKAAGATA